MIGKDTYTITSIDELTALQMESLFILYQPLCAHCSIQLYLTLFYQAKHIVTQSCLELTNLMNTGLDDIDQMRLELEQFSLLKTYQTLNHYDFVLQVPLKPQQFLEHELYARYACLSLGKSHFDQLLHCYSSPESAVALGKDISASFDIHALSAWDDEKEKSFKVKSEEPSSPALTFDLPLLLAKMTEFMFPTRLRTADNLRIISELGSLYKINVDRMRTLVLNCVGQDALDLNKLTHLVHELPIEVAGGMPSSYELLPYEFLAYLQKGTKVSGADRRLLERLQQDYHLKPEVINVMIEHILKVTAGSIRKEYVEKVAAEWSRKGVNSLELALQTANGPEAEPKKVKKELLKPVYTEPAEVNEEELLEMRKKIKEAKRKANGTS